MKRILIPLLFIVAAAGVAFYVGAKYGANLVRNGLVANHPTMKNLTSGSFYEADTAIALTIDQLNQPELFNLLAGSSKSDTILLTVPYYARYGVDLNTRYFRVVRDKETVEVSLPAVRPLYIDIRYGGVLANGVPVLDNLPGKLNSTYTRLLYPLVEMQLQKHRQHKKAAEQKLTQAVMYYFMPYQLDLLLYIDNQRIELPLLPGVNQDVDEYLKETFTQ